MHVEALSPHEGVDGARAIRRRELLRGGFWFGIGVVAAGGLAAAADFLNPRDIQTFGATLTVPPNKIPSPGGGPYYDRVGRFWLVNLKPSEGVPEKFQSVALPSRTGGLLALYEKCPHLGTPIDWLSKWPFPTTWGPGEGGWFRCPSHGATFTKGGVCVFGPAPRSMDTFAIVGVSDLGVRVNTGHVLRGGTDDPQRTVPAGPYGEQIKGP